MGSHSLHSQPKSPDSPLAALCELSEFRPWSQQLSLFPVWNIPETTRESADRLRESRHFLQARRNRLRDSAFLGARFTDREDYTQTNVAIHTLCCELFLQDRHDPDLSGRGRICLLPAFMLYRQHLGDLSF